VRSPAGFRTLAGLALLWALVPLPFSRIVAPPFWVAALAAGAVTLLRRRPLVLSVRAQNLAGLIFLAVVLAAGGWRIGPLRPLGHLLLLLASLRVLGVHDRKSHVAALGPVGLVWVLAVASSTHVTLMLYLVLSVVALWWGGMRTLLLLLAGEEREVAVAHLPRPRNAVTAALVVVLLAVPVFLFLPRLRSPMLSVGGGRSAVTGFSTAVELSGVGEIQRSSSVVLVVGMVGEGELRASWLRLRATAFDLLRTGTWVPRRTGARQLGKAGELVRLDGGAGSLRDATELRLESLQPEEYLFVPPGTVAVRCPAPLWEDRAGGLVLRRRRRRPITYTVWVREGFRRKLAPPDEADLRVPRSRERLRDLALTVTSGAKDAGEAARRIVDYLRATCRYSLESPWRFSKDPVSDFLFLRREGHCELFAGSMTVLLRSMGIPARMVGGYSGGDLGPRGRLAHVRQSNAHTWVEVWLGDEEGWRAFDPTPAESVPGLSRAGMVARLRWTADRVQVFWDRYVLTFGLQDQLDMVTAATSTVLGMARRVRPGVAALWSAALTVVGVGLWWLGRRRRRRGGRREAARVVARIERVLRRAGVQVTPSDTPRDLAAAVASLWPGAAPLAGELAGVLEAELYGPAPGTEGGRTVRWLWRELRREVGRTPAGGIRGEARRRERRNMPARRA